MEIIVLGTEQNLEECKAKFGGHHTYLHGTDEGQLKPASGEKMVFDFLPSARKTYPLQIQVPVFVNAVNTTLLKWTQGNPTPAIFGFCGLPTFLNREWMEVTIGTKESIPLLEKICSQLDTKFKIVKDQTGMVTSRIICMIINEAFFAAESHVASRSDIDLAMKLGTNYPFGPFEWCEKIGIRNVCKLLDSVYLDTKDERYKTCELLKKEAGY
ncbi:MAG: 3-hydroxyacyl-CoA dehydrogenase [Bacteroidetes bacterium]|nr:3-hydroxyacyl-CoA dehydrogenase [Bacteroidota bacterium]